MVARKYAKSYCLSFIYWVITENIYTPYEGKRCDHACDHGVLLPWFQRLLYVQWLIIANAGSVYEPLQISVVNLSKCGSEI
jgi:hypothetical protein